MSASRPGSVIVAAHILVVGAGGRSSLALLAVALERAGYAVHRVDSSHAALARAAHYPSRVALVDLALRGGDAAHLCRALRVQSGARVVVVYSTEEQHVSALSLVRDGARDCLSDGEDQELAFARVEAASR